MNWWQVEVRLRNDSGDGGEADLAPVVSQRESLAAWLVGQTGQAVLDGGEEDTLIATVDSEAAAAALTRALQGRPGVLAVNTRHLPAVDWSTRWREGLGVRRLGRLVVVPSWIAPEPAAGEVAVMLDPENAFGSGEHGSTRGALTLLERHLRAGDTVLDLGSGSGILAIAAVKLGASRAVGVEEDDEAIPVAERNAERNQVTARVEFIAGDAGILAPLLGPADLVCSNILRTVNQQLLPAIHDALRPGGVAVFAGMETVERDLFLPPLEAHRFRPVEETVDEGWWSVAARRS